MDIFTTPKVLQSPPPRIRIVKETFPWALSRPIFQAELRHKCIVKYYKIFITPWQLSSRVSYLHDLPYIFQKEASGESWRTDFPLFRKLRYFSTGRVGEERWLRCLWGRGQVLGLRFQRVYKRAVTWSSPLLTVPANLSLSHLSENKRGRKPRGTYVESVFLEFDYLFNLLVWANGSWWYE